MRYQDIWFGRSYKVKRSSHRVEVIGVKEKNRLNGRYRFPVRYPDARPGSKLAEVTPLIEAADFVREWTEQDEEQFSKHQQQSAQLDAIERGLRAAGFQPNAVRYLHTDELYVTFQGDTAHSVVAALLKSVAREETIGDRFDNPDQALELEKYEPHDED